MNRLLAATVALAVALLAGGPRAYSQEEEPPRPPGAKNPIEELLKSDREKSLKDLAKILKLAEELKENLENTDRHILSVADLRKAEEIEKLAKNIKSRMRRY